MTADQLRAAALRRRVSASGCDVAARELSSTASRIDSVLGDVAMISRRSWSGPAADDFEREIGLKSSAVNDQASPLSRHARELWAKADSFRDEARRLDAQADRLDATAVPLGTTGSATIR